MPKRLRRGMLQGEYRNVKGINQNELTGNENCETRRSSGNIQDILVCATAVIFTIPFSLVVYVGPFRALKLTVCRDVS